MNYLLVDCYDLMFDRESKSRPLSYMAPKGKLLFSPERLKLLRNLLKKNPKLKIVIAPNKGTRLSILDFKDAFKTFAIDPQRIDIVDLSNFFGNEEITRVLQMQEYLRIHRKYFEDFKILLSYNDITLNEKISYMKKFHEEMHDNIVYISDLIDQSEIATS